MKVFRSRNHGPICLFVFLAIHLLGCDDRGHEIPEVVIVGDDHSFGELDLDGALTLNHEFTLANRRSESLSLSLKPDCGCVVVSESVKIGPGGTVSVPVSVTLEPDPGPFKKRVVVLGEGKQIIGTVLLHGTIKANGKLRIQPDRLDFGLVSGSIERELFIRRWNGAPLKLKRMECPAGLSVSKTTEVPGGVLATVRMEAGHPAIESERMIKIVTDDHAFPTAEVPYHARWKQSLAWLPSVVPVSISSASRNPVSVELSDDRPAESERKVSFQWEDKCLVSCEIQAQGERHAVMRLSFDPAISVQSVGQSFKIRASDGAEPQSAAKTITVLFGL